jgi:hypothetical protein
MIRSRIAVPAMEAEKQFSALRLLSNLVRRFCGATLAARALAAEAVRCQRRSQTLRLMFTQAAPARRRCERSRARTAHAGRHQYTERVQIRGNDDQSDNEILNHLGCSTALRANHSI